MAHFFVDANVQVRVILMKMTGSENDLILHPSPHINNVIS